MLKLLESNNEALPALCKKDAFGTRIAAYYHTYGTEYPFALFYLQEHEGEATAALGIIDGQMTLCCDGNPDFEELAEFIHVVGFESLLCGAAICEKLGLKNKKSGPVVEYEGCGTFLDEININMAKGFELPAIYDILRRSEFDGLPEYLPWLTDVSHRLKKGTAEVSAIEVNGTPAACAMAVFKTQTAAVLGAVATLPEYRGNGYAGALVKNLAGKMKEENRKVNLLCADGSIIEFYKNLGFVKTGGWALI